MAHQVGGALMATSWDEAARWAKARQANPATKAKLKALNPWDWCAFYLTECSITYQSCRFCKRGHPEVKGLWHYAVRHYACNDCKMAATGVKR